MKKTYPEDYIDDDAEDIVRRELARNLHAQAWVRCEEEWGRCYPGCNIYDVMPATTTSAVLEMEKRWAKLIKINDDALTVLRLLKDWWVSVHGDATVDWEHLGSDLGMYCEGTGCGFDEGHSEVEPIADYEVRSSHDPDARTCRCRACLATRPRCLIVPMFDSCGFMYDRPPDYEGSEVVPAEGDRVVYMRARGTAWNKTWGYYICRDEQRVISRRRSNGSLPPLRQRKRTVIVARGPYESEAEATLASREGA